MAFPSYRRLADRSWPPNAVPRPHRRAAARKRSGLRRQGLLPCPARFATAADADLLCAYLDRYLPKELHYNQDSTIGALLYLDEQLSSNRADRFLTPGGLWEGSTFGRFAPADFHHRLKGLCAFADKCMTFPGPKPDTPGNPGGL